MQVRPYETRHGRAIEVREPDRSYLSGLGETASIVEAYQSHGPALTFIQDGRMVALAGLVLTGPGEAEAWLIPSDLVARHALGFHRAVRRELERLERDLKLKLITATVLVDYEKGRGYVESLGFVLQGRLSNYGPRGEDVFHYARSKSWPIR